MYKRPGRPQHLAGCVQRKGEKDLDYLTRWSNLRNTCEGVKEHQAISYFVNGCLDGTMLKHKLLRAEPQSMEHLMIVADKYATIAAAMKTPIWLDSAGQLVVGEPAGRDQTGTSNHGNRPNGQDDRDRPYHDNRDNRKISGAMAEERYDAQTVNTTEANQLAAGGESRYPRPRQDDGQWNEQPNYTLEGMLEQPCKYHSTARKPATHTTA